MSDVLIFLAVIGLIVIVVAMLLNTKKGSIQKKLLPYRKKNFFFTRSEQEFFRLLTGELDKSRYSVFPKVRMADYIEVSAPKAEYISWWNKIKSKHVDFVVWSIEDKNIALVIELDGKSHNSERVKERDAFVNTLYEQLGLRLERIAVGSSFSNAVDAIVESLVTKKEPTPK